MINYKGSILGFDEPILSLRQSPLRLLHERGRREGGATRLTNNDQTNISSTNTGSTTSPSSPRRRHPHRIEPYPQTSDSLLQHRRPCRHSSRRARLEAVRIVSHTKFGWSLEDTIKRDTRYRRQQELWSLRSSNKRYPDSTATHKRWIIWQSVFACCRA